MIDGLELRTWMGSVDETIVAKHAARMGLVSLVPGAPDEPHVAIQYKSNCRYQTSHQRFAA